MKNAVSMVRGLVWVACAGLALGLAEAGLVLAFDRALFLSAAEQWRYIGAALGASTLGCAAVLCCAASLRRYAWLIAVPLYWALWLTTQGRRVRDLPGRSVWLGVAALLLAWLVVKLQANVLRVWRENDGRQRLSFGFALGVAALALTAVDGLVLRRLYPAAHWSLAIAGVSLAVAAVALVLGHRTFARGHSFAAGALLLCSPWLVYALQVAPNAAFAAETSAPITGKLIALSKRLTRVASVATVAPSAPVPSTIATKSVVTKSVVTKSVAAKSVDLHGQDVLLITVDALRADRLRVYGGHGVTPELDALAQQSVVFERAYTTTPHTSYALASLLTGKFMRPILELARGATTHATLAGSLRRFGYRTAAFYPPAVFFVDAEKFHGFHLQQFDFEYVKAMYASGDARVKQLETYLARAEAGHSVLAWVHLFEPHEPYEPPPGYAQGDTPEALYDGEVRAADAAVGALVREFRRARPNSTVIVTADHGEELGDHGGQYHGTTLYDEQIRVPLLWSSPGVAHRVIDAPVEHTDVVPTLLAGLGIPRDVRMRGDDLGALLATGEGPRPDVAIASIDVQHMVFDGTWKAICNASSECRLFNLKDDPRERRDRAAELPERVAHARAMHAKLAASIPQVEALGLNDSDAWPEALARAELGDATAGPELIPLLGARSAAVRAGAARFLGELGVKAALPTLLNMAAHDESKQTQAECLVAAWLLGDDSVRSALHGMAAPRLCGNGEIAESRDFARRAALALAKRGDTTERVALLIIAADVNASEPSRTAALDALASTGAPTLAAQVVPLLADVRLRGRVARTLGALGGSVAKSALLDAFKAERYPNVRTEEARALVALRDARALPILLAHLGRPSGVPQGLAILEAAGWLARAGGTAPRAKTTEATFASRGVLRVLLRVNAETDHEQLTVDGVRVQGLAAGEQEVAVMLTMLGKPRTVGVSAGARIQAYVAIHAAPEIPAPAPEPWDAGVGDGGDADALHAP